MAQDTRTAAGRRRSRVEQGRLDTNGTGRDGTDWDEVGFGGPQVCKIVGITYRQLDYWARTDLVRPSLADAKGSGTQRRYSYTDLVRLKVVKNLLDAGVKLADRAQGDRVPARRPRRVARRPRASSSTARTRSSRTGDDLVDLVRRGQGVLNIVPLGSVVHELDASIHDLAPGTRTERDLRVAARAAQGG